MVRTSKTSDKLMCEIQRFFVFPKNDWRRHQNSLVLWIVTKHFACVLNFFFARRNQYTNVGKTFLFLKLTHIKFDNSIVLINQHSIVIAAERSVITLVLNMGTCKDNWKGLNESEFPAHLYLSQYYIFQDHSVNFTVDSESTLRKECLLIDFIALIAQKLTISKHQHQSRPLLIKVTAKYGILCPKTLLLMQKQLQAIHFFVATCNVCPLAIP